SYVTTTLVIILFTIPVIITIASLLSWYLPSITKVNKEYIFEVRLAFFILILTYIINRVFDVFEAILRGMNIGYKRLGIKALITIVGGCLTILAINLGFGIRGLAAVHLITSLLLGLSLYSI